MTPGPASPTIENSYAQIEARPMELKQFVTETLRQILEGVAETENVEEAPKPGRVNPPLSTPDGTLESWKQPVTTYGQPVYLVEFDIAVTVDERADAKAGLKVLGIGIGGELAERSETVNRIKFSVPVEYPRKG